MDASLSFEDQAKQLSATSRIGDMVRVSAPLSSMGRPFNGMDGALESFNAGGWVVVNIPDVGSRRFRADELQVL